MTTIVIFGASGDLTRRKLVPALYNLYCKGRLPEATRIVGAARRDLGDEAFRDQMQQGVQEFSADSYDNNKWLAFASLLSYAVVEVTTAEHFGRLDAHLREYETNHAPANRLYYLSVAPRFYEPIVRNLGTYHMDNEEAGWRRVVIEKPFGTDLLSAQDLNRTVHTVFDEKQVYRIDHYLGKETAQNLTFFRFANTIFEPLWNRNYIDHVQITVGEAVDVGHRAGYYDQAGVLRDMFQNHLLQLLALVAMEPPSSLDADAQRNEKVKVLNAIRPIQLRDTVRARYRGYLGTEGVAPDSQTATYAALKLYIDNWRWQGVPFYLRSGKALKHKVSEMVVQFRRPPLMMFDLPPQDLAAQNVLSLCIQPDEGIHLSFEAKLPDSREGRSVDMDFHYSESFGKYAIPEAYERLLLDALLGDASLFTRSDGIEAAWRLIDPIISGWETSPKALPIVTYDPGTWGPVEADSLLELDGRSWRLHCLHEDE